MRVEQGSSDTGDVSQLGTPEPEGSGVGRHNGRGAPVKVRPGQQRGQEGRPRGEGEARAKFEGVRGDAETPQGLEACQLDGHLKIVFLGDSRKLSPS